MENNQTSSFDLLRGKANFTNEPLWYRLLVYLIQAAFYLLLICLIREWLLPLLAKNLIQEAAGKVSSFWKGRSP
jgi:hypothetical protein